MKKIGKTITMHLLSHRASQVQNNGCIPDASYKNCVRFMCMCVFKTPFLALENSFFFFLFFSLPSGKDEREREVMAGAAAADSDY